MGIGGIGIWQLLIILVIVLLLFGTKKLRNLGGDLGGAIKGFKQAISDKDKKPPPEEISGGDKASDHTAPNDSAANNSSNSTAEKTGQ